MIKFKSQPVQLILNGVEQTGKGKFSALGTISATAHVNPVGTVSSIGWSEVGITDELKNVDFVEQHALLPIYLPKELVVSPNSPAGAPWTTNSDDGLKMAYSLSVGQFLSDGGDNEAQLHVTESGTQTDQGTSQGVTCVEHAAISGGVDELFDSTSGLIRSKTSSRHRTSDATINNPASADASTLQIDQTWTTDAELTGVNYPN